MLFYCRVALFFFCVAPPFRDTENQVSFLRELKFFFFFSFLFLECGAAGGFSGSSRECFACFFSVGIANSLLLGPGCGARFLGKFWQQNVVVFFSF